MYFFTMGASQCQTLSCKEPKILENSKEHLLVCCLLIRVLLAQHFTYITHLLGKQIDSFVCFLVTLASLVLLESGSRFLPVGKSFCKEGWVFLSACYQLTFICCCHTEVTEGWIATNVVVEPWIWSSSHHSTKMTSQPSFLTFVLESKMI